LWGEVDKVENELFWCEGGAKLPAEAVIKGEMDKPFFLISLMEKDFHWFPSLKLTKSMPNLVAVPLDENKSLNIKLEEVYCVYNQRIVELCNNGNRTKELSFFEKLSKKYNLNV
jgi:hypothetical protein